MRTLLILVATLLAFSSCEKKETEFVPRDIEIETISSFDYSGKIDIQDTLIAITNSTEFNKYIRIRPIILGDLEIDFTAYTVLIALDKRRSAGGFDVVIEKVTEHADRVVVMAKQRSSNGPAVMTPTQPHHIVKIPNLNKPFEFRYIRIG